MTTTRAGRRAAGPPRVQQLLDGLVDVARRTRTEPCGSSRLRSALPSASVKLRPMAIASPTLFMWVVRVESAAGNFSNANRGTLTTT